MAKHKNYKCVNCDESTDTLYRTYGPSVLKLNKCKICNGIVDKYIEYDPVIVIIDLVLMSKEAQRHLIYNTEFKPYWKLFIILMLLETYGLWSQDSLFNIAVKSLCDIQTNFTANSSLISIPLNISLPESWASLCNGWSPVNRTDVNDLFIWEKDFYIQFISTFTGVTLFLLTVHCSMKLMKNMFVRNNASFLLFLKSFSLAYMSSLFGLPMLVWGTADSDHLLHYLLVFAYSFIVYINVVTVLYECPTWVAIVVLIASNTVKYLSSFQVTPRLRTYLT